MICVFCGKLFANEFVLLIEEALESNLIFGDLRVVFGLKCLLLLWEGLKTKDKERDIFFLSLFNLLVQNWKR